MTRLRRERRAGRLREGARVRARSSRGWPRASDPKRPPRVYRAIAEEVVRRTAPRRDEYERVFCFEPAGGAERPSESWLRRAGAALPQSPGDIGARMERAFDEPSGAGRRRVVAHRHRRARAGARRRRGGAREPGRPRRRDRARHRRRLLPDRPEAADAGALPGDRLEHAPTSSPPPSTARPGSAAACACCARSATWTPSRTWPRTGGGSGRSCRRPAAEVAAQIGEGGTASAGRSAGG